MKLRKEVDEKPESGILIFRDGAVKRARADIDRLEDARSKLDSHHATVCIELRQLQATLGEASLDAFLADGNGKAAEAQRTRIRELEIEESGTAQALAALIPRLVESHRLWNIVRGGELRKRAAEKQEQLDKHLRRRDELLKALQDFEGPYVPQAEAEMAVRAVAAAAHIAGDRGPIVFGKSTAIAKEISALLAEAATLEARMPPSKGSAAGASLEELLTVTCENPEAIAPSRAAVEAWYRQAERDAERSWYLANGGDGNRVIPPRDCTFMLVWDMGKILPSSGFTNMPKQPDQGIIREQARQKQQARATAAQVASTPDPTPAERQTRADAAGRQAWPVPAVLGEGARPSGSAASGVQDFVD